MLAGGRRGHSETVGPEPQASQPWALEQHRSSAVRGGAGGLPQWLGRPDRGASGSAIELRCFRTGANPAELEVGRGRAMEQGRGHHPGAGAVRQPQAAGPPSPRP